MYTDGACLGNPGPGGWAWAVPGGRWRSGPAAHTTNQRMEIMAALDAARSLPGRLEIVSDSTYVVNCFRDGWWVRWLAKGWVNAAKKPVANRDLWEPLVDLYRAPPGPDAFPVGEGPWGRPFQRSRRPPRRGRGDVAAGRRGRLPAGAVVSRAAGLAWPKFSLLVVLTSWENASFLLAGGQRPAVPESRPVSVESGRVRDILLPRREGAIIDGRERVALGGPVAP